MSKNGSANMRDNNLTMLAVGDLILRGPKPDSLFALAAPVLRMADVLVGQGEIPFTARSVDKYYLEVPTEIYASPACDPVNMSALASAGFNVITLASNHTWDSGVPGIEDTINGLQNYGIAVVGAGMNINEASRPAVIERNGTHFGFLNYNCTGPKLTWATPEKPGCAYVHIVVAYELEHPTPGGTPTIYTFAEPRSLGAMVDDIHKLRPLCDVLVVCFHKGLGFERAKLAMYEQQVSYAAIDAGADLILGHHAHILRGVEYYKEKAIFHGLGNFVIGREAPTPQRPPSWAFQQFERKKKELLGPYSEPDTEYQPYPFHPETMQTIIAKCTIKERRIFQTSYIPCMVNKQGQPEILKKDERGQHLFDYMDKITQEAGLNARYEWKGDEVLVHAD